MKLMYTKANVNSKCPTQFSARLVGEVACCEEMHTFTRASYNESDPYNNGTRVRQLLHLSVSRNDEGVVLPRVHTPRGPSASMLCCPYCGHKHEAVEVKVNHAPFASTSPSVPVMNSVAEASSPFDF